MTDQKCIIHVCAWFINTFQCYYTLIALLIEGMVCIPCYVLTYITHVLRIEANCFVAMDNKLAEVAMNM